MPNDTNHQFVHYLNSLQRTDGKNENALAESQACNKQFAAIHVPHPLTDLILSELNKEGGDHIILTGHAGDGKSTIALDLYKRLKGIGADQPLDSPPKPREDIGAIAIIKDLSERDKQEDQALLEEMASGSRRFLLVSNTGTLIDLTRDNAATFALDPTTIEEQVLRAISAESGEARLVLGDFRFRVFNLALLDNLSLAKKIFHKMLDPKHWQPCQECERRPACPIALNVALLTDNDARAVERIFLAYRRMYEYGARLTIRQFTEHLASLITAGLEGEDIARLSIGEEDAGLAAYLFFNRFFGDNGKERDANAQEMQAIRAVSRQGFGDRPVSSWEHRLWLRGAGQEFSLRIPKIETIFQNLRRIGARVQDGRAAREQVRRMLFFLYDFATEEQGFLSQYLCSPTLLQWLTWQREGKLVLNERDQLDEQIYPVLQEHFTGVRLPEGMTKQERRLYVTLSRHRSHIRQSAQIVLAQVDWSTAVDLVLRPRETSLGRRRYDLVLQGKGLIAGLELLLPVPFLDYVMIRRFGELGEVLDASYRQRLDHFKAQVQERAAADREERFMLVRLRPDHTFHRQYFSIEQEHLEVRDVL